MEQSYLNDLFSDYKNGIYNRSRFEGMVYDYYINNQEKTCLGHWKHNEYEDFMSWFYQRLHKAITSYREISSSFDVYMGCVMRTAAKEYRIKTTTKSVIEYSAWCAHISDYYTYEESPVYTFETHEKALANIIHEHRGISNPKELLALILKCYYYVSDDFIERIAKHLGYDRKELMEMVNNLRALRQKKDDNIYLMRERIFGQYYRCIVYERRLLYYSENTHAHTRLKKRLDKARQRLEKMRKRIAAIRTDATNRQVANIIGVSKGTVDSCLHRLKTKWDILSDKSLLN